MTTSQAAGAAVGTGLFLSLAQPTMSVASLAWVGLVPLLLAVRGAGPRKALGLGYLAGMSLYLPVLYWIAPTISNYTRVSTPLAIGVLVLLCLTVASFVAVFALTVEWLADGGIPRVVSAPLVWVALEWSRMYVPAAFPWALLGYSQYGVLPVIQSADLFGVWGVSALLVFVNAVIAEVAVDGVPRHRALLAAAAVTVVATVVYGWVRIEQVDGLEPQGRLTVGVTQGNVAQDRKWNEALQDEILDAYLELSRDAARDGAELVIWPEAALPVIANHDLRTSRLTDFATATDTYMLVGAPAVELHHGRPPRQFNSVFTVVPDHGFAERYDKIQLVPFGEYVPFGWLMSWVGKAVEGIGTFGRGTRHVVFEGPPVLTPAGERPARFAALICYEGIFPGLTRRFVVDGADFLVNVSNDAWYGRTSAPHQHLAMAAVRAVENRVPLVRSTNTGVSAIVDAVGRIRERTPLFERAVFVDELVLREHGSLYLVIGDLFVYVCLGVVALLVAVRLQGRGVLIRTGNRGIVRR